MLRLAKEARRDAANFGCDILIVDTAGRNQIAADLMDEMAALKKLLNPSEILFVADAMTGQDAVKSAKAFHDSAGADGRDPDQEWMAMRAAARRCRSGT